MVKVLRARVVDRSAEKAARQNGEGRREERAGDTKADSDPSSARPKEDPKASSLSGSNVEPKRDSKVGPNADPKAHPEADLEADLKAQSMASQKAEAGPSSAFSVAARPVVKAASLLPPGLGLPVPPPCMPPSSLPATSVPLDAAPAEEVAWTVEQQKALEQAMRKHGPSVPDRWDRISEDVVGMTRQDCIRRFKQIGAALKAKKAAVAALAG